MSWLCHPRRCRSGTFRRLAAEASRGGMAEPHLDAIFLYMLAQLESWATGCGGSRGEAIGREDLWSVRARNMLARKRRRLRRPALLAAIPSRQGKIHRTLKKKQKTTTTKQTTTKKNVAFNGTPGRVWHRLVGAPTILNRCPRATSHPQLIITLLSIFCAFLNKKEGQKRSPPLSWIITTFEIKLKTGANSPARQSAREHPRR